MKKTCIYPSHFWHTHANTYLGWCTDTDIYPDTVIKSRDLGIWNQVSIQQEQGFFYSYFGHCSNDVRIWSYDEDPNSLQTDSKTAAREDYFQVCSHKKKFGQLTQELALKVLYFISDDLELTNGCKSRIKQSYVDIYTQLSKLETKLQDVNATSQSIIAALPGSIEGFRTFGIIDDIDSVRKLKDNIRHIIQSMDGIVPASENTDDGNQVTGDLSLPAETTSGNVHFQPSDIIQLINALTEAPSSKILDPACGSGGFMLAYPGKIQKKATAIFPPCIAYSFFEQLKNSILRRARQLTKKATRRRSAIRAYYRSFWHSLFISIRHRYTGFYPVKVIPCDGKLEDDLINVSMKKVENSLLHHLKIYILWAQKKWSYY